MALKLSSGVPVIVSDVGSQQVMDFQVDGDASYPTGGYTLPVDPQANGLLPHRVEAQPTAANQGYLYDYAAKKLIFTDGAGSQITNGVDVSARKNIRVRVWSIRGQGSA